jgi:hypothetical protein
MSRKLRVAAALFLPFVCAAVAAADPVRLTPSVRTGVYNDNIGFANLVVRDMTGDGIADVVSCSRGSAVVLSKSGAGLAPVWFSEPRGCAGVAVGDTDGDGSPNVIVGGGTASAGFVYVYDSRSPSTVPAFVQIPGTLSISDVAAGDVDHDGKLEIVAVTSEAAYVFDAKTLALEWTATGKGGRKVLIGDLEGDGANEIVVSGETGHILDAAAKSEKWGYPAGFGRSLDVADVDGDGKAEIVYLPNVSPSLPQQVIVLHGDTLAKSPIALPSQADVVAVGDANGDGAAEILIGDHEWGAVRGFRPSDGVQLWSIDSPDSGRMAIGVGDVTGDGSRDVVWGSGWFVTGPDLLVIGNPNAHSVTWRSEEDLGRTFGGSIADLDGDGRPELVVKTTFSGDGIGGGMVLIFDLATRTLKTTLKPRTHAGGLWIARMAIAQLDNDPALEIILFSMAGYSQPAIVVFDGATGVQQYTSPDYDYSGSYITGAMAVANVDADPVDEVIVGTSDSHLLVLNGASSVIQWDSGALDGAIRDIAVADVDSRGGLEYVVATAASFYVISASTGAQLQHVPLSGGFSRAAATSGRYALAADDNSLRVYSREGTLLWNCALAPGEKPLALTFTTVDGVPQLVSGNYRSDLRFYPVGDGVACPAPEVLNVGTEAIADLVSREIAGDPRPQLVIARDYSVEVDSVGTPPCSGAGCPAIAISSTSRGAAGLTLQGTYSGAAAIASVRFATSGASMTTGTGTGSGTTWSVGPIATPAGTTRVTIIATDTAGHLVTQSLTLASGSYLPVAPPAPPRRRASH